MGLLAMGDGEENLFSLFVNQPENLTND